MNIEIRKNICKEIRIKTIRYGQNQNKPTTKTVLKLLVVNRKACERKHGQNHYKE